LRTRTVGYGPGLQRGGGLERGQGTNRNSTREYVLSHDWFFTPGKKPHAALKSRKKKSNRNTGEEEKTVGAGQKVLARSVGEGGGSENGKKEEQKGRKPSWRKGG